MSDFLPFVVVGLTAGSVYGLAGTGLVLTYKTSGILNFAHGTIAAVMAYAFYDLRELQGLPWPIAMAVCLLVLAPLIGLGFEVLARRLSDAPVASKVVATLGLLVGFQQIITLRYGGSIILPDPYLPDGVYRIVGVNVGLDQIIVMVVALAGMIALNRFLATRSGRQMLALVDEPELLAMHGVSPVAVRRRAWVIGTVFAGLSGILLAPTVGLFAIVLTLLVVQAFGAAAIGRFTSIPLTYAGGIAVGLIAEVSKKFVGDINWLAGFPPSVPFIVLFGFLVFAPRGWLLDFTKERKPRVRNPRTYPLSVRVAGGTAVALLLWRLPELAGTRLSSYTTGMAYVIIFLSLALLVQTSGQVSLAQLGFAAVGAAGSARLAVEAGLPWLFAVVLGAVLAVPVGAILAIPAIRRSGIYLALATLGFAILLERLVYFTSLMYATANGALPAPRPSIATTDRAYFYVVVAFVFVAIGLVVTVRRSRLGRLLQAMADSPTALDTGGTNTTVIKVLVFCISSFLAGLGGALVGPVTGRATPAEFGAFASLFFLVLIVVIPGSEVASSIGAAFVLIVLPSYSTAAGGDEYQPVFFGLLAVFVGMAHAGLRAPTWLRRAAVHARTDDARHPARARVARLSEPVPR